jgi:hypothetical protein
MVVVFSFERYAVISKAGSGNLINFMTSVQKISKLEILEQSLHVINKRLLTQSNQLY